MGITVVILLQNPFQISKQARQAINNHIFTTTEVFQQYIESIPGGNILKKKAGDAIEAIVGQDEKRAPKDRIYSKIILNGDDIEYVTADKMGTQYPVGCARFRSIMDIVEIRPESRS
jgi:phosphatidate phosphatase PAH1